jgi:hypothetical protein
MPDPFQPPIPSLDGLKGRPLETKTTAPAPAPEKIHVSPEGVKYRLVATRKTTPTGDTEVKEIKVDTERVEVLISDSRMRYMGSQFGHVAITIDDLVYSRAHERYVTMPPNKYIHTSQQVNMQRDTIGIALRVSPSEKLKMKTELERRIQSDKDFIASHPGQSNYSIVNNSCSTNVADVLESIGILAHDPRFFDTPVTPQEMLGVLQKSKRVIETRMYPAEK